MNDRRTVIIPGHGPVTLMFNSWFARLLGGPGNINNAVTLNRYTIRISRDWIQGPHLAHEFRHTIQAAERGWGYLPWVCAGYLRTWSHDRCPAEIDADAFMAAHGAEFPPLLRLADIPAHP